MIVLRVLIVPVWSRKSESLLGILVSYWPLARLCSLAFLAGRALVNPQTLTVFTRRPASKHLAFEAQIPRVGTLLDLFHSTVVSRIWRRRQYNVLLAFQGRELAGWTRTSQYLSLPSRKEQPSAGDEEVRRLRPPPRGPPINVDRCPRGRRENKRLAAARGDNWMRPTTREANSEASNQVARLVRYRDRVARRVTRSVRRPPRRPPSKRQRRDRGEERRRTSSSSTGGAISPHTMSHRPHLAPQRLHDVPRRLPGPVLIHKAEERDDVARVPAVICMPPWRALPAKATTPPASPLKHLLLPRIGRPGPPRPLEARAAALVVAIVQARS